jgi:hypothetical protein
MHLSIFLSNRTYSKAVALAGKYGLEAFELDRLQEFLPLCDVVVVPPVPRNISLPGKCWKGLSMSVPRNKSTWIFPYHAI